MIKGPKAILSSAISNALGEYFIVDADTIESNLLSDAKIVLRNVQLKEQTSTIPLNSAGKSTLITVTGCVEMVSFTWSWSVGGGSSGMWVNDCTLTIDGAKFRASLEHVEPSSSSYSNNEDDTIDGDKEEKEGAHQIDRREAFVNPSTIDRDSARKIKEQKGGVAWFVAGQVKMIIDSLTLRLLNFELRIVLPHQQQLVQTDDSDNVGVSATNSCNRVLVVGGKKIEIISHGREKQILQQQQEKEEDTTGANTTADKSPPKLRQRINLDSFASSIHMEGKGDQQVLISYPLLEPFSYSAETLRVGERFGGFMRGLEVLGLGEPNTSHPNLASLTGSGISVHMSHAQIDFLMQLSIMILAPPNDCTVEDPVVELESNNEGLSDAIEISSFTFPLALASLKLFDDMNMIATAITARYKADGTVCSVELGKMEVASDSKGQASATEIVMSMRPKMQMKIGCIENLHVPNTVLLSTPIESCELIYEGNTLIVKLDTIDVVTFTKKNEEKDNQTESGGGGDGSLISAPYLPCNISLSSEGMQIKKDDGSLTKMGRFHLYALKEQNYSRIAIQFESFRNYLLSLTTVSLCGSIPLDQDNIVNDFIFTAGDIKIQSGHSTDEWETAFQPRKQKREQQAQAKQSSKKTEAVIMLPGCNIEDLNVEIGVDSSLKIGKIKDTKLVVKAFRGNAGTTNKDLTNYYIKACLARVPDFISNAEVLGLNVVDNAAGKRSMSIKCFFRQVQSPNKPSFIPIGLWATWAAIPTLGSTFGAGAGVAVVAGVDAIKGAVDAGKRRRNADEGDKTRPGDFMRGLVQAAAEATRDGAARRGKSNENDANIIDWTVGATQGTADYVVENKNKLGAAGAGGGGFLLGMALGGPVGAVVGALAANATTGMALEGIDEHNRRKNIKQIEEAKGK